MADNNAYAWREFPPGGYIHLPISAFDDLVEKRDRLLRQNAELKRRLALACPSCGGGVPHCPHDMEDRSAGHCTCESRCHNAHFHPD